MYELFTDGGCYPNPGGPMGFAFVLKKDGVFIKQWGGASPNGTNQKAELWAAIHGLRATPVGSTVTLYSDSQYVTKGLTEWREGWVRRGWAGVANVELWWTLDDLVNERLVTPEWIRGHSGHPENEVCDGLAKAAYAKLKG